jgi:DNA-binding transcriptional ArsR family regulator
MRSYHRIDLVSYSRLLLVIASYCQSDDRRFDFVRCAAARDEQAAPKRLFVTRLSSGSGRQRHPPTNRDCNLTSLYARQYIYTCMHLSVFQTLADPMRLRIVETLRGGEYAVNDLVDKVEIHQSGVSRHLRILHEAGFVKVRPEGQKRLYSLRPEPFHELDAWVTRYRSLWDARLDKFAEALSRKQKARPTTRREIPK